MQPHTLSSSLAIDAPGSRGSQTRFGRESYTPVQRDPAPTDTQPPAVRPPWYRQEDGWAIFIGLGMVALASLALLAGESGALKLVTVKFGSWRTPGEGLAALGKALPSLIYLYALLLVPLSIGAARIGYNVTKFGKGLLALYGLAVLVTLLASNTWFKAAQLEGPLVALFVGLAIGNTVRLPAWLHEALRTEYFVKTGIVLMGATLPFTIILQAGPAAISQALIVSFCFCGLLEGLAGFGAPVAITAAMLVTLGLDKIKAALVTIVGNLPCPSPARLGGHLAGHCLGRGHDLPPALGGPCAGP